MTDSANKTAGEAHETRCILVGIAATREFVETPALEYAINRARTEPAGIFWTPGDQHAELRRDNRAARRRLHRSSPSRRIRKGPACFPAR